LREEQAQVLEDQLNVKEEKVKEEKPTKAKVPVRESSKEVRETKDEKIDAREEKDDGIIGALKLVAPGTRLREGLDSILRAKTGALIVLGDSAEVLEVVEGGFHLDAEFAPPSLYELAKMDGAIVLSEDARRILYANAQLIPDPSIPSVETGIRHRTAERVARQTGTLVIAISQRRGVITLYRGANRYSLQDISVILSKANQAVQTLEKYKRVLDKALVNLTALEFEDLVTVYDVVWVVQRGEMVLRIVRELKNYISELGAWVVLH
jgi:diadenylate cyclase